MEIVVAVKPVPEAEARLRANADGSGPDDDGVKFVLAGYDESAVEQALLLKESAPPSSVHAVALGPPARCEEVLRACLALGCDRASVVDAPSLGAFADPMAVARGIATALRSEKFDVLLFGKQAGDDEEGLVGPAVAELLGVGHVGYVADLRVDGATGRLAFRRIVEHGEERWESPVPVAISLQQAWNDPRTAKLPSILRSRKSPVAHSAAAPSAPTAPSSQPSAFALPPPRTGAKLVEYATPQEAASKLVKLLREEAKVFP